PIFQWVLAPDRTVKSIKRKMEHPPDQPLDLLLLAGVDRPLEGVAEGDRGPAAERVVLERRGGQPERLQQLLAGREGGPAQPQVAELAGVEQPDRAVRDVLERGGVRDLDALLRGLVASAEIDVPVGTALL